MSVPSGQHDMASPPNPSNPPSDSPIDFAILTAIEVERKAICAAFGLTDDTRVPIGARVYWRGRLRLKTGEFYEIVVAQSPEMAGIDAALLTSDTLRDWKPGAALMVGIAASANNDVKLGDVVVANDVYYYDHGKAISGGVKPEPKLIPADATLWSRVTAAPNWDGIVPCKRPDRKRSKPTVHRGVIASGEKVIADASVRSQIVSVNRKIIAIEMESYGFSRAIHVSQLRVHHLSIRGICDDANSAKNDDWHEYAASAAAAFARHFLFDRPLEPLVPGPR